MDMVIRFLRALVASFLSTRYIVSILVVLIVLFYALLTLWRVVPFYEHLANTLSISPRTLLIFLYLLTFSAVGFLWYYQVLRPEAPLERQRQWRELYRLTDHSGLLLHNLFVLLSIVVAVYIVHTNWATPYLRQITWFLAVVVALPIAIDLVPVQRPRRIPASHRGSPLEATTLHRIADDLSLDDASVTQVTTGLIIYNDLEGRTDFTAETPLDPGMIIEIPPRF